MRACNALVLKLDYLSTTVCQKLHFLLSDAILRILSRASWAGPRTLRVSAHISREDTQDGVSVGGFKMAAMSPVQLYIGQCYAAATSSIFNGDVYLRHNANYVDLAQIHGYISGPSTVICLHYKSYRAEPRQFGPSPPPLGGPGPNDI